MECTWTPGPVQTGRPTYRLTGAPVGLNTLFQKIQYCNICFLGETNNAVRKLVKEMATVGARNLWRQMGQTCQNNAYGILLNKYTREIGVAAVRANARMKLRVLGTLLGRRDDAQYHRASREEARFREAEWDNYLRHGPRGRAEYHHGSEHCI